VKQARALRKSGHLAEAREKLAGARESAEPSTRTSASSLLARIHLAAGEARGARELAEAAAEHRAAGRLSEALSDELASAFWLVFSGRRYAEAEAALGRARALVSDYPEGRARLAAYEAMLAYETGRLAEAGVLLRVSAAASERLGLTTYRASLVPLEADVALALGRLDDARRLTAEGEALGGKLGEPCDRATLDMNLGWVHLRIGELAGANANANASLRRGAELSTQALTLFREACPRPLFVANTLTNLAYGRLAQGDEPAALALVAEARRTLAEPDAETQLVWLEVEGRTAHGEPAFAAFRRMRDLATALRSPLGALRAEALLGRALADAGQREEAERTFAEAARRRDALAFTLPLEGGRLGLLAARDEATWSQLALRLRGEPRGAADLARRSIARALRALAWTEQLTSLPPEKRARWNDAVAAYRAEKARIAANAGTLWTLSEAELATRAEAERAHEARLTEALAAAALAEGHEAAAAENDAPLRGPQAGELIVVMHPLPEGWVAFGIDAAGTEVVRLAEATEPEPPEKLAERLLAGLAPAIARATSLRFVVHGALRDVDFQALPFEGEPLIARRTVTYGLDLPSFARSLARPFEPRGTAMVVADPRGDLPHARDEAARVTAALASGGARVTDLAGGAASYERVVEGLGCGELSRLHFAGHGRFAGESGLASGLALSGGAWLTVADVLTMPSPPVEVVLSGCETARAAAGERPVGVGIAHAFLLAGSRSAVAATRPVGDDLARRLMIAYYASAERSPEERLRAAQNVVRVARPDLDWAAFRALVP
jgi:hypothetical protein